MDKLLAKPILVVSLLIVLCGYLFFFQLGKLALTDPDETFYAQTAKEMVAKGEWVTPHLYGKPQFEKPILFYWLVELSYKVFGVNEFAARFPSAVFALIGVIAIYFLGSLLFSRRAGFFAALALATCVEYIILSRACITDMVLSTFMLLGVLFFFYGYVEDGALFYMLSAAMFAFATLTKGPIAIMLGGAAILAYMLLIRDFQGLRMIPYVRMALVFCALTLPWYIAEYLIHGAAFLDAFFGFHNVTRFLSSEHKIGSQFYYNIPIILGGFFPWSAFLPFGLWHFIKKLRGRDPLQKDSAIFTLVWLAGIFIFFTASSTKLPTYIFPCFISLALIVGALWDDFLQKTAWTSLARGVRYSLFLLVFVVVVGAAGIFVYIQSHMPSVIPEALVSGAFLVFGMLLALIAFVLRSYAASFLLIVYAVMVFLIPVSELVLPDIERYETSKAVSQKLSKLMKPDEKLGAESNYLAGLAFYTGKVPADLDKHHDMINFMNSPGRVWAVMKMKNHNHLYNPEITKEYVKTSYMISAVGKRALITTEPPADGLYLKKKESTYAK